MKKLIYLLSLYCVSIVSLTQAQEIKEGQKLFCRFTSGCSVKGDDLVNCDFDQTIESVIEKETLWTYASDKGEKYDRYSTEAKVTQLPFHVSVYTYLARTVYFTGDEVSRDERSKLKVSVFQKTVRDGVEVSRMRGSGYLPFSLTPAQDDKEALSDEFQHRVILGASFEKDKDPTKGEITIDCSLIQ